MKKNLQTAFPCRGVQGGVVLHTERSAKGVRGARAGDLLPGGCAKEARGAKRGGFAHGRVREGGSGCKKGWFCTRKGPRRGSGCREARFAPREGTCLMRHKNGGGTETMDEAGIGEIYYI